MTNDDLVEALMNDSFNVLNSFLPIPKESIKWVYERMKKNPVNKFLDSDRERIQHFYSKEKLHLLRLQFNGEIEHLPQHLEIDNTLANLDMSHFMFEFNERVFELPSDIVDQTGGGFKDLTAKIDYTNEENLRLSKLDYRDGIYTFCTQPVYYKSYLHSNMIMDYPIDDNQTLRDKIHSYGQIEKIEDSKLANHLGINILLFTPAGYLVLPLRSKKVSYAPSELSASISGAVSAHDVSDGKTIDKLSIIREGIEELGLERTDIINESITFLGLTRELVRGGKPEFFFSMQTTLTKKEIKTRWSTAKDKWENKTLQFYPFEEVVNRPIKSEEAHEGFQEQVNLLFEKLGANMSLPLLTNLALWIKLKQNGF